MVQLYAFGMMNGSKELFFRTGFRDYLLLLGIRMGSLLTTELGLVMNGIGMWLFEEEFWIGRLIVGTSLFPY